MSFVAIGGSDNDDAGDDDAGTFIRQKVFNSGLLISFSAIPKTVDSTLILRISHILFSPLPTPK